MKVSLALLAAALTYKRVSAACFSEALGYDCCKGCTVVTTDESGKVLMKCICIKF